MMDEWRPRNVDRSVARPLVEGVPRGMYESLKHWVAQNFERRNSRGGRVSLVSVMREYDLVSDQMPLATDLASYGINTVIDAISSEQLLDLADWCLYRASKSHTAAAPSQELDAILTAGSSVWKVGKRYGAAGLIRRVPEGVQDAADAAMSTPGDAGKLLAEAWTSVYGRVPDPSDAYDKAIKAVEAASTPVVKPTDSTASLSKVIGQMRADGNWTIALDKEHKQNPLDKVLLDMMQALMSGHSDRHPGTPGYLPTSQEAAVAAVGLAVTLVHWFTSGAVKQVQP